jgi:hypothetical protein
VRSDACVVSDGARAVNGTEPEPDPIVRTPVTLDVGCSPSTFPVEPQLLLERACTTAGRTLTQAEWHRFLPERPYQDPCGT